MDATLAACLSSVGLGEPVQRGNMAVVPLFVPGADGPVYVTLEQAIDAGTLSVAELSKDGSVPELRVLNGGADCVLLLDGEELHGAKQNRVLNTTILVAARSETVVPVACTERGRWHYTSPAFSTSDVVMSPEIRKRKMMAVHQSLTERRDYSGDQRAVWDAVANQTQLAGTASPTAAMRDIYTARQADLEEYVRGFWALDGQQGLLVFVNGQVQGFDLVSRSSAYSCLHEKLLRSYAMDALLARPERRTDPAFGDARTFLLRATDCDDEPHQSVGLGLDHRCTGKRMVGSALVHEDAVVHAAFFRTNEGDAPGGMASSARRRLFRT